MPIRAIEVTEEDKRTEEDEEERERILFVGDTGTGKTTQIATLPGPKIIYAFDPNCVRNLKRLLKPGDLLLECVPGLEEVDIMPRSVKERVGGNTGDIKPKIYQEFINDFDDRYEKGEFVDLGKEGGWVCIDSVSFLQETIADAVRVLQAKAQSKDQRSDAEIIGQRMTGVMRIISTLPCNVACTAHYRVWKAEDGTKSTSLDLYGRARAQLPKAFSDIFSTFVEVPRERGRLIETEKTKYLVQTVPEPDCPISRTALTLDSIIDVTLDLSKDPEGQGVGAFYMPQQPKPSPKAEPKKPAAKKPAVRRTTKKAA